jgi:segregation and condensation protein A
MKNLDEHVLTLENFEGPIGLLLHLVQKNEVDICGVFLKEVTQQYLRHRDTSIEDIDEGAEFISTAAALLLLKSRALLPQHNEESLLINEELDPRFEIIHYLIDYCRFKAAADELKTREEKQGGYHVRGITDPIEAPKPLGVGQLSLGDLCVLFQQVLSKVSDNQGFIQEEQWKVSDKIFAIKQQLVSCEKLAFHSLFSSEMCRGELIVTFLAILELMKQGIIAVTKIETGEILIEATEHARV